MARKRKEYVEPVDNISVSEENETQEITTEEEEHYLKINNTNQGLIIAREDDREILRLMLDGRIYVHGNYADTDQKVVNGLRMLVSYVDNTI